MTGKEEMTVRNKKSISLLSLIAAVFTVVTMAALFSGPISFLTPFSPPKPVTQRLDPVDP